MNGHQTLFANVMAGRGLEYERIQMNGRWVSETLQKTIETWDGLLPGLRQPVLINAPTGSGKSTFILNDLAAHAKSQGKLILLLSNRYALSLQQKKILMRMNGEPMFGQDTVSGLLLFDNVLILTYQRVLGVIRDIKQIYGNRIGFVVFDEAHFFVSDATFNPNTSMIHKFLLYHLPHSRRIYLSATPEDVKPLIALEEHRFLQQYKSSTDPVKHTSAALGKYSTIIEYYFPVDYSFLKLNFPCSWDDIVQKCNDSLEKWLIFVSSKDEGRQLKRKIKGSEFVDASTKKIHPNLIAELVNSEMFRQKVLITTSTLDNGINFNDEALKNIVIDTIDQIQAKQMLGRKRRSNEEIVNLYVMQKLEPQIDEYSLIAQKSKDIYLTFKNRQQEFYAKFWGELTENQQQLFGLTLSFDSTTNTNSLALYTNDYAIWQLERFIGDCEMLKARFAREGSMAFIKEVCDWFGLEYTPEMGESTLEKTKKKIIDFLPPYVNQLHMEKSVWTAFVKQLIAICDTILPQINKTAKIYDDEGHYKSDANNIFNFFSLPYQCAKLKKKESGGKELWIINESTDSSIDSANNNDIEE